VHGGRVAPGLLAQQYYDGATLSKDARQAARRIAAGMGSLPSAEAAYAIGTLYTTLLPEVFRAQHGIFYTPPPLVECLLVMAEQSGIDWTTARVLDPACGGGAFLVGVARRMMGALEGAEPAIILQSIGARLRGFDIDPFGAWLAQAMVATALRPLAGAAGREVPALVATRDSLSLMPDDGDRYDLVIGNPPYGRVTLPPERRARFARSVYGHANLYGVFTEAALYWATRGGVVGYVTPTSMLSGLYYRALRALLAAEAPPLAVNFVSERDGVFAGVLQETMLATYRKGGPSIAGKVGFIDVAGDGQDIASRKAGSFALPPAPHSPWLLPRSATQAALARRLRAMPHRLDDYGYGVSTGPLVWNRYKEQFRAKGAASTFPVIWAESVTSDGRFLWRSEKRNHAPWFAAKRPKDDWLIVTQQCVLLQRTTAKEQARRLIAAELPESFISRHRGVIIENHLNMVRAIVAEPEVPAAVIAALLNSAAVDAAFRCLNGSVAVSAFELEELPLPAPAAMKKLARLVADGAKPAKIEAVIAIAYGRNDAAASA
jgi:adenine-specific DNA-methyltransferase